jgi:hypothetical protein
VILRVTPPALGAGAAGDDALGFAGADAVGAAIQNDATVIKLRSVVTTENKLFSFKETFP